MRLDAEVKPPSARVRRSRRNPFKIRLRSPYYDRYNPAACSRAAEARIYMITVAAIRMEQFGVQFYQASLTARDVDRLVRFEVLSYTDKGTQPTRGKGKVKSKVN